VLRKLASLRADQRAVVLHSTVEVERFLRAAELAAGLPMERPAR
jgi:hypothetical protein